MISKIKITIYQFYWLVINDYDIIAVTFTSGVRKKNVR